MKLVPAIGVAAAAIAAAGLLGVITLLSTIGPLPDGREVSRADLELISTIPAVVIDAKLPPGTAGVTMAPLPPLPMLAYPPRSPHYWTMDESGSASP